MSIVREKFHPSVLMPTDGVTWWVEIADTVDRLRGAALTEFHLGDVPAELKARADTLNRQTDSLIEELRRLRHTIADNAGDTSRVSCVRDMARETFGEWDRHTRRVTAFFTETAPGSPV